MLKWKYIVKETDDDKLENVLNEWAEQGLEVVTVYPRGSGAVFAVFRKKVKEKF